MQQLVAMKKYSIFSQQFNNKFPVQNNPHAY